MSEGGNALLKLASNVKLFNGIPMHLLGQLVGMADKVPLRGGELFFNEGDSGESFYILIHGHVAVEQSRGGKWILLAPLHPGDSFGEMTLVDDKVRSARVRATTDCLALYFPLQRLKSEPEITTCLYRNIAKVLVKRLKSANNVVLDLTAKVKKDEVDDARGALAPVPPGDEKNAHQSTDRGTEARPKPEALDREIARVAQIAAQAQAARIAQTEHAALAPPGSQVPRAAQATQAAQTAREEQAVQATQASKTEQAPVKPEPSGAQSTSAAPRAPAATVPVADDIPELLLRPRPSSDFRF